jgi:CheY-like chemotaxis protein
VTENMAQAHSANPTRSNPSRILIVDDELSVREFVSRVLEGAGYATAIAVDGAGAMQIATSSGPFDLLLTDVMMPYMNGDELAIRLRRSEPALKVLYLTGYCDQLFVEKIALREGEAFLDKPCTVKGLLEAVSLLLFGRASTAEHPTDAAAILRGYTTHPKPFSTRVSVNAEPAPVPDSPSRPPCVLLVDDDPETTQTFARMLKLEGYDVRTAINAEAGLQAMEVSAPDAILLDLHMPLVDGLAFLRRLRADVHQQRTPVAIVTGDYFIDDTISNELSGLGVAVYLKPLWLEDLVSITHALVNVGPTGATPTVSA